MGIWGAIGVLIFCFLTLALCVFVGMLVIGRAGKAARTLRGGKPRGSLLFSKHRN
ncbi:MAG: hypothetical protein Q4C81_00490 [Kocuria sp.]|nr:hypothetical protein [Kocuria sp.]